MGLRRSDIRGDLIPRFFGGSLGPFIIRPFSFKGEHLAEQAATGARGRSIQGEGDHIDLEDLL